MIITGIGGKNLRPLHWGSKEKRIVRTNEHEHQQLEKQRKKPQLRTERKCLNSRNEHL